MASPLPHRVLSGSKRSEAQPTIAVTNGNENARQARGSMPPAARNASIRRQRRSSRSDSYSPILGRAKRRWSRPFGRLARRRIGTRALPRSNSTC
jgi:hypothetical protein